MRRSSAGAIVATLGVVLTAAPLPFSSAFAADPPPHSGTGIFEAQRTVSTAADGAWSVVAADVDGDGDMDVLSASQLDSKIAWYENDGTRAPTTWTEHVISTVASGAKSVYAVDVDADGDLDVLSASYNDNKIAWYEHGATQASGAWTEHSISTAARGATWVSAADVDGDGDVDVLSASFFDNKLAWYESDGMPSHSAWPERVISTAAHGPLSVVAADVDGDGDEDALSASQLDNKIAWYENGGAAGTGAWTEHAISTSAANAWAVFAADVDGDGAMDVLSASNLSDEIAWYRNGGAQSPDVFTKYTISTAADGARSVFAADVDGDGDIDVLSASQLDNKIAWYENDGTPLVGGWAEHVVTTDANGTRSVFAADVDGDGDTDVLSASNSDDRIAWYEQQNASAPAASPIGSSEEPPAHSEVVSTPIPAVVRAEAEADTGNARPEPAPKRGTGIFPSPSLISTDADGARSVFAADVDGDGDADALSASNHDNKVAWYENDGTPTRSKWSERAISTDANGAYSVFATDVDGDGDTDVLSASYYDDRISWYENDGTPAVGAWTGHEISSAANGAASVFALDVDGDGDTDVVSASFFDNKIAWYENDGTPAQGSWTEHAISTTAIGAASVFAADLDGDGDMDVLSASITDNEITWYENAGTPVQGAWSDHEISTSAHGAFSVFAADVDGDGDLDVLSASQQDNKIAWYENAGTPSAGAWTEHEISTAAAGAKSVFAADVDGDGDLDVLSASQLDNKIAWYENDGTPALGGWNESVISIAAEGAFSVYAADVDGDGDTDVLSASQHDNEIAWYPQQNAAAATDSGAVDDRLPVADRFGRSSLR